MTWVPRPKEIDEVTKLDGKDRYEYFVKHVVDEECVVGLWTPSRGWDLLGGADGECFALWPHEAYAAQFAERPGGSGAQPKRIALQEFFDRWIPGMTKDEKKIAVFPVGSGSSVVVEPARLAADLRRYREEWFGEDDE